MDASYTHDYEQFELRHWWFVARRGIIHDALSRHTTSQMRWLDVGCGSGVLLHSYPAITNKLGLEMDGGSVARAQAKGLDVRQVQPRWDFSEYGKFDLITLTDVIEHVEHEKEALDAVWNALTGNGILLVTVPALMSLWSGHDVVNHHFRRYTRKTLLNVFPTDRWEVLETTYFSSFLLPMIWLARKLKNLWRGSDLSQSTHDMKFGKMDWALLRIFSTERWWLKFARFPLGSSVLLVARKKAVAETAVGNAHPAANEATAG